MVSARLRNDKDGSHPVIGHGLLRYKKGAHKMVQQKEVLRSMVSSEQGRSKLQGHLKHIILVDQTR